MQLYTFEGDFVLDPFCGVGSTCVAAVKAGRRFVGYDTNPQYVELAQKRIAEIQKENMT
jgi:site-specific DNA-methyltransferase (adenine-specific)